MRKYFRPVLPALVMAGLSIGLAPPCPAARPDTAPVVEVPAAEIPLAKDTVAKDVAKDTAAEDAIPAAPEQLDQVVEKPNLVYYDGPDADRDKHKLDLFLPKGRKHFPVVMFVHGGAWLIGDKGDFGIYAAIGRMLASHGIGAAVINYRLSPQVQHPEHIKDVARAFAWLHKNMARYGGRPDRLFICGHSAGGHLVALLGTDESWLRSEGLSLADIHGVIPISGVYTIPHGMFKSVFGTDPEVRRAASPTHQVRAGCPPFLIVYGDHDFPFCDAMSVALANALHEKEVEAPAQVISPRNHIDIIFKLRLNEDPCAQAVRDFVFQHSR